MKIRDLVVHVLGVALVGAVIWFLIFTFTSADYYTGTEVREEVYTVEEVSRSLGDDVSVRFKETDYIYNCPASLCGLLDEGDRIRIGYHWRAERTITEVRLAT